MNRSLFLLTCLLVLTGWIGPLAAEAGVIVVANRTDGVLDFDILDTGSEPTGYRLHPGESRPISTNETVKLRISEQGAPAIYELRPYAIYFFERGTTGLTFQEIGFSTALDDQHAAADSNPTEPPASLPAMRVVKVKVVIDDELLTRRDPEPRIRRRVNAASAFFEQMAGIRFEIVDVEHWNSIDRISNFSALMVDFERKVPVEPDVLAIGFSTQASRSKRHMGGTRLPLHSHVLVRERGQRLLSEPAQLELLIHELGHYLGAVHSPERTSAMRPKLGDRLADTPGFRIGLDPVNTMIVALVGEELRGGEIGGVWDLSPKTKYHLRRIYTDLAKSLPEDPAAGAYLKALALTAPPPESPRMVTPLAKSVRGVVQAITAAAEDNIQRPDKRIAERYGKPYRLDGDELTEVYIRRAAQAAGEVSEAMRPQAFAIGLAVALDSSRRLRDQPLTRILCQSIETEREHQFRIAVLGQPTIRGRYDLVQHFSISAGLAALFGTRVAEAAGVWKEKTDGVFSRSDYSADLAGIRLVEWLTDSPDRLEAIAEKFKVADYLPLCLDTDHTVPQTQPEDPLDRKSEMRAEIVKEIESLPPYVVDATSD